MGIGFAIMTILSAVWFFCEASVLGWFGIRCKRRVRWFKHDAEESSRLLRILERYKNGELLVQKSMYGVCLVFTKVRVNPANNVEYDDQVFYVHCADPESFYFGWIDDDAYSKFYYEDPEYAKGRKPITTEAWLELMDIHNMVFEKNTDEPKTRFFGKKHKNEEVHLS